MTIDTTATEPPRNWFLEITGAPTEDLLNEATRLRAKLAIAQQAGHRVDARAYELRLGDVERAIAVHNRRATESLDQQVTGGIQQREVDTLLAVLRHHDEHEAHALVARMWTALQAGQQPAPVGGLGDLTEQHLSNLLSGYSGVAGTDDLPRLIAEVRRRRAQPALTEERVREVVRAAASALLDERKLYIVRPEHPSMNDIVLEVYGHSRACDAVALQGDDLQVVLDGIADRVAKELAGAVVGLSAEERAVAQAWRDTMDPIRGEREHNARSVLLDRLLAGAVVIAEKRCESCDPSFSCFADPATCSKRPLARDRAAEREADLRDAFCAGFAFAEDKADISEHDGWHRTNPRIEWPSPGQREEAAAEYARSKAGG